MKKVISMLLGFMLVISLIGCGKSGIADVKIDYGASAIYTEEDMNAAIEIIKKSSTRGKAANCIIFHISLMKHVTMLIT